MQSKVQKLKRLQQRYFSLKAVAILFLNTLMPSSLGKMIDIAVDKQDKNLAVTLKDDNGLTQIDVSGYRVLMRDGSEPQLQWQKVSAQGQHERKIKALFEKRNSVELSSRYVSLLMLLDKDSVQYA